MTETLTQDLIDPQATANEAQLVTDPLQPAVQAPSATSQRERTVKARVLVECEHGRPNDLIELPSQVAKAAEKIGLVDTDKAAVAYAASLASHQG